MDNFFTSYVLTDYLATKRLTVVGTLRSNKPEIPSELTKLGDRELHSSMFAFRDNAMLVSYVAKKNKIVNLMSSMHTTAIVEP